MEEREDWVIEKGHKVWKEKEIVLKEDDTNREETESTRTDDRNEGVDEDSRTLYIETSVFVDQDLYRHMLGNFPSDTKDHVLKVVLAMVNAVSGRQMGLLVESMVLFLWSCGSLLWCS